jgi:hypothetical protein
VIKQGAVMTKRKPPDQIQKNGRMSTFLVQYVSVARRMAYLGATDRDLAAAFNINISTIWDWRTKHPGFADALKLGKKEADQRTARSLYQKANGYSYDAVKIFMPAGAKKPIYAPYVEHVPPSDVAMIFWLKNRDPANWRDAWQLEHVTGKYVISDQPMTEEQWIKERAVVIDAEATEVTPALEDQSVTPVTPQGNGKAKK